MKRIAFVVGLPSSGKSTFIERKWKGDVPVFDAFEYQKDPMLRNKFPRTFQGDVDFLQYVNDIIVENAIETAIRQVKDDSHGTCAIIENTFLKACRRETAIDLIRKSDVDVMVDCYYTDVDIEEYERRCAARHVHMNPTAVEIYEIPSTDEGFDQVFPIR